MAAVFRKVYDTIANGTSSFWRSQQSKLQNCFKVYRDAQVNEFFWCSCLLGGILKTKKVSPTCKKIWMVWDVSSMIIMLALNIACLVFYEEKNRVTFRKISRPILTVISVCFGNAIFYLFMDLIENYTDSMDKRIDSMDFDEDARKFNGEFSKFEIFVFSCTSSFFIIGLLNRYFLPDIELLQGVFSSHYPFNDNFRTYPTIIHAIILFIEFLTTLQINIGVMCMFKLTNLFIATMGRTFDFYLKQIANIGSSTLQQMENNHNEELLTEQNEASESANLPEEFIRQRKAIEDNFEQEMAYCSKQIWSLIGFHSILKPLFEYACAGMLLGLYAIAIPLAGQLLWVMHHPTQITVSQLHAVIFFPLNVYLFYKLCGVGAQISDMLEQFPVEVYSSPWYMMSKKTRRTIHIFLAQTQYEHQIRIFKTVPINMRLFYQFVDSLYSNGSFIHSVVERQK